MNIQKFPSRPLAFLRQQNISRARPIETRNHERILMCDILYSFKVGNCDFWRKFAFPTFSRRHFPAFSKVQNATFDRNESVGNATKIVCCSPLQIPSCCFRARCIAAVNSETDDFHCVHCAKIGLIRFYCSLMIDMSYENWPHEVTPARSK